MVTGGREVNVEEIHAARIVADGAEAAFLCLGFDQDDKGAGPIEDRHVELVGEATVWAATDTDLKETGAVGFGCCDEETVGCRTGEGFDPGKVGLESAGFLAGEGQDVGLRFEGLLAGFRE